MNELTPEEVEEQRLLTDAIWNVIEEHELEQEVDDELKRLKEE